MITGPGSKPLLRPDLQVLEEMRGNDAPPLALGTLAEASYYIRTTMQRNTKSTTTRSQKGRRKWKAARVSVM